MKRVNRSKIIFVISAIFFVTGTYANLSNFHKTTEKNSNVNVRISNVTKDEEQKVLELLSTMDEAMNYSQNNSASYEIKKQLMSDLIKAANSINIKLDYRNNDFIDEANNQYYNLIKQDNMDNEGMLVQYKKWRNNIFN